MTTIALLRQTYLNTYLRRADGANVPWTDSQANQAITDALQATWNDGLGRRASGTVATSQSSDVYTIPAAFTVASGQGRISSIELERTAGGITSRVGVVTSWDYYSDTQVRIRPALPTDATLALRFFGWVPYLLDASDLPVRLESPVSMKAAALAFGQQIGFLVNSQMQQGLDSGRVVDYQTDVGASAYWERRYRDAIDGDQSRKSYAVRHAHRQRG